MADLDKMDRTWLCSVLFMDIINYSSQSVELQMKWKKRFNGYLSDAIREVPESERVILDTGDGAAVCFLGAPEVAMFAALQLSRAFALDEREQQPGLRARIGINLGPVKLVRDLNGALNAIGDGINAGQRIMSFASENRILVSQSFFEVVSRLSDDYKGMFQLKGVETDKHVREHTVYHLSALGGEKREPMVANSDGQALPSKPKPAAPAVASSEARAAQRQWVPWLVAGVAVSALAAAGVMHFRGSSTPAPIAASTPPVSQTAASTTKGESTTTAAVLPSASANQPAQAPLPTRAGTATENMAAQATPAASPATDIAPVPAPNKRSGRAMANSEPPASPEAKAAYDDGMRLIEGEKPAEAARRFDDAIHASPDYVDAYVGRAEARRMLLQYALSLEDCNKIVQLQADDPRGYNCRGFAHQMLKQFEQALPDFNEAIRLNPKFIQVYEHRGTTYEQLQQYDHAVEDFSQAIALAPRNALFYVRRGGLYNNLKQYDKAIRDFTEAIRLQPANKNAYRLRALAEQASGDSAGAAADRERMQESPKGRGRKQ